jgi:hypothetical protein
MGALEPDAAVEALASGIVAARARSSRTLAVRCALSGWLAAMHLDDDPRRLELLAAAKRASRPSVVELLRGGAARKVLPHLGRLPEARFSANPLRVHALSGPPTRWLGQWHGWSHQRRRALEGVALHPDPQFVAQALGAVRPDRLALALEIARRRPTTHALTRALVESDWMGHPRVRAVMAENPFTPAGVVAALLLSTRRATASYVLDCGPPALRSSALARELAEV